MLRRERAIEIAPGSKPLRWRRYHVPQHLAPETSDALRCCAVEGDLKLLDRRHRSTIEPGSFVVSTGPPLAGLWCMRRSTTRPRPVSALVGRRQDQRTARLLAGLRECAVDLRVDAQVVERAGENRYRDRAARGAATDRPAVVAALPGGDGADDEPYERQHRPDVHPDLPAVTRLTQSKVILSWSIPANTPIGS